MFMDALNGTSLVEFEKSLDVKSNYYFIIVHSQNKMF